LSRDDEDRWIERTVSDGEFADAVWSGTAPIEDAPPWYPELVRILGAAGNEPALEGADPARGRDDWSEVVRRARRRRRRRRVLVAGAVALGVAVAAGGAAAATGSRLDDLPLLRSGPVVGDAGNDRPDTETRVTVADASAPDPLSRLRPDRAPGPAPGAGRRPARTAPSCQPEATREPGCSDRGRRSDKRRPAQRPGSPPGHVRATPGDPGPPAGIAGGGPTARGTDADPE
jgi:hypothetical protein